MRYRSIACLLSLTLIFNSVAPCLAFAVGEGVTETEQETEQALTEVDSSDNQLVGTEPLQTLPERTPSDIQQEAKDSADTLGREYLETHPYVPDETIPSPVNTLDLTDDSIVQPRGIIETAEEILYAIRTVVRTINDNVSGVFSATYTLVQAVVSYHGSDTSDFSYGSLAYFIKYGYFVLLNIAADLENVMTYVKDIRNASYVTESGSTYYLAEIIFKFFSYKISGYRYGAAELFYYMMANTEYKHDGTIYSMSRILFETWKNSYYMSGGYKWTPAEALLYTLQNTDDMKVNLQTVNTHLLELIEGIKGISVPDVSVEVPEVSVSVDPSSQAFQNSQLYDEILGSLDTAALVSKLDELSALLEKAFPFCLVFGLVAIIELLVAPADAPSFEFPLPDGSGGTYLYMVDLEAFDPVAGVFRGMITIVYIIGLIRLTNTFVFKGGSE